MTSHADKHLVCFGQTKIVCDLELLRCVITKYVDTQFIVSGIFQAKVLLYLLFDCCNVKSYVMLFSKHICYAVLAEEHNENTGPHMYNFSDRVVY